MDIQGIDAEEFSDPDEYLKRMRDALVEFYKPHMGYLFGSRTRGTPTEKSGYDFLVAVAPEVTRQERAQCFKVRWEKNLTKSTDILVWPTKRFESRLHVKTSLASVVSEEGRLLYAAR